MVIAAVLTSVTYLVGTKVGLALTLQSDAGAVLWPPNALLLAALLLSPRRIWWLLLLAVLPPHLAVELKGGVPATMAIAWYVSNCLEALIGATIFRAWAARGHETHTVSSFGVFMLGATFFATFVSSFVDAGIRRADRLEGGPVLGRLAPALLLQHAGDADHRAGHHGDRIDGVAGGSEGACHALGRGGGARRTRAGDLHHGVHGSLGLVVLQARPYSICPCRYSCGRRCASAAPG